MPLITIAGTVIDFPDSGDSPDWSEAIIQFAEAVASSLNIAVGSGDISPNFFIIDALNPGSDVAIPGLQIDTNTVRSTEIRYAVIRERDSTTLVEEGYLHAVYNPDGNTNEKWVVTRDYVGESQVSFVMEDTGQVTISTTAISGSGLHTGTLSFVARSLLNG